MLVAAILIATINPFVGHWVAVATNGVQVREDLYLHADHTFRVTERFTDPKWRKNDEATTGTYTKGTLDFPDGRVDCLQLIPRYRVKAEVLRLIIDPEGPILTDIITTAFARVGEQKKAYEAVYKKPYRRPW